MIKFNILIKFYNININLLIIKLLYIVILKKRL
jgi:hypothetical protein